MTSSTSVAEGESQTIALVDKNRQEHHLSDQEKKELDRELQEFFVTSRSWYTVFYYIGVFGAMIIIPGFMGAAAALSHTPNDPIARIAFGVAAPLFVLTLFSLLMILLIPRWQVAKLRRFRLKIGEFNFVYKVPTDIWNSVIGQERNRKLKVALGICALLFVLLLIVNIVFSPWDSFQNNEKLDKEYYTDLLISSVLFFITICTFVSVVILAEYCTMLWSDRTVYVMKNGVMTPAHYIEFGRNGNYQLGFRNAKVVSSDSRSLHMELDTTSRAYKIPLSPDYINQAKEACERFYELARPPTITV